MGLLDGSRGFNGTPPVALCDASHGQPNWSQTGLPSRQFHTNLAGLTEILCGLGYECRATNGEPLTQALTRASLLIIPPPTGRYDARRERWRRERSSCLTKAEVREALRFLQAGGRMLAFAYRFGDSFTQTNLGELCLALGCRLNDDAVIDVRALRQTDPLHLHFDTPCESLPRSWSHPGVRNVRWRQGATFTILPGTTAWPLALSTGGSCLSFNRTLRRISFDSLPIAIAGCHGTGRFALFGGPHLFESSSLGLLAEADNRRFLHNVLAWLHDTGVGVDPVAEPPGEPMVVPDIRAFTRVEGSGNGDAHRRHAPVERGVGPLVLDGVAAFVGGHAQRGGRAAVIVLRRQHQALVNGVVMVTQHSVVMGDFHVANAGAPEDLLGHFATGQAGANHALVVAFVNRLHAPHRPERKGHRADKEYPDHSSPFVPAAG